MLCVGILIFGVFLLGREGGLNCEVAPLPAPSPTHPPTTLAVQAAPEFNSNETKKHKISRIAIQILLKFSASVARTSSVARGGGKILKSRGSGGASQLRAPLPYVLYIIRTLA